MYDEGQSCPNCNLGSLQEIERLYSENGKYYMPDGSFELVEEKTCLILYRCPFCGVEMWDVIPVPEDVD